MGDFQLRSVMTNAFECSACKQGQGTNKAGCASLRCHSKWHTDLTAHRHLGIRQKVRAISSLVSMIAQESLINTCLLKHKSEAFSWKLKYTILPFLVILGNSLKLSDQIPRKPANSSWHLDPCSSEQRPCRQWARRKGSPHHSQTLAGLS